eukprot:909712-Rhodomonas_salina.2
MPDAEVRAMVVLGGEQELRHFRNVLGPGLYWHLVGGTRSVVLTSGSVLPGPLGAADSVDGESGERGLARGVGVVRVEAQACFEAHDGHRPVGPPQAQAGTRGGGQRDLGKPERWMLKILNLKPGRLKPDS